MVYYQDSTRKGYCLFFHCTRFAIFICRYPIWVFLLQMAGINGARFEKYRSKLHIFRSLVADLRKREYSLWGGKPHSFGNINVPSSQGLCKGVQSKFICFCKRAQPRLAKSNATLISRCRFEKYRSKLHIFRSLVADLRQARI